MKCRLPSLCVAALVVVGLGMQWAVLHAISLGTDIIAYGGSKDVSIGTVIVKSLQEHQSCSVCEYLNQKHSEEGQKSVRQTVNIEIEAASFPSTAIYSANIIWTHDLIGPSSVGPQFIDSISPPPPQSAV